MRATGFERAAQRCPGSQQMRLSHVFIEGLWAQPVSERAVGAVACSHLPPRPITSTPGGGTNENRSGGKARFRFEFEKVNWVI